MRAGFLEAHSVRSKVVSILAGGAGILRDGNRLVNKPWPETPIDLWEFSDLRQLQAALVQGPSLVERKALLRTFNAIFSRH